MEERWIAKRQQLFQLLTEYPDWENQMYAEAVSMSLSWVKDWKKVYRESNGNPNVVYGQPRYRRTPQDSYDEDIIDAVLDIRDEPPSYCNRVPGPAVIQYELKQRYKESKRNFPRSTSTIWKILDQHQRIIRPPKIDTEKMDLPAPFTHWEIDFADVTTVPATDEGKKQHVVEMLNIVDRGTSILVDSEASDDYNAKRSIMAVTSTFMINGLPDVITMDRDPRFMGGSQKDLYPSAFMRYLMCLGIEIDICPPRRPDMKPFVERINRTIQHECIYKKRPSTLAQSREELREYRFLYNSQRPHQGRACGNVPPYQAFPRLPILRTLPITIDPDSWLNRIDGRIFERLVQANGSVKVDNHSYYVGKKYHGKHVTLQLQAETREFKVMHKRKFIKQIPVKGLYNEVLEFQEYLDLICREAHTEWRTTKRLVRERRLIWARVA